MSELITRKRGSKWEYQFEVATIEGKRKRFSKSGFRTKAEAVREGTKAKAEYNSTGKVFTPSEISMSDYLDYFYDTYCRNELRYNSREKYRRFIKNHFKPAFKNIKLVSVTPSIIQNLLYEAKAKGLSKGTVKSEKSCLSKIFGYAVNPCCFIADNPVSHTELPKFEKEQVNPHSLISEDEFAKIITLYPFGHRYHIPVILGWVLGLRAAEVSGLMWNDIDFENNIIRIEKQAVYETGNGYFIRIPKTASSVRMITFGNGLKEILLKEKERQIENEELYRGDYTIQWICTNDKIEQKLKKDAGNVHRIFPVCVDENGKHLNTLSIKSCSRAIRRELGIDFDFHSLRVSNATHMIENEVDIKAVQERLGHRNISITYNIYVRTTPKMMDKANAVADRLLSTS